MKYNIKSVCVLGDGGWGTTLAIYLTKQGYAVNLWGAFAAYVSATAKTRENKKFLPGFRIPRKVKLTANMPAAVNQADLIVLACPSEYLVDTLKQVKATTYKGKLFLSVIKGIDAKTFKRMSQLIIEYLGPVPLAVLSGPTIAKEMAAGLATTAVIASSNPRLSQTLQKVFNSDIFRVYTNSDVAGVELGGSIKNVIAIACGLCDGLGLGTNAKSAILARGLSEISRLGLALGGRKETFYGLTGLGDLATTCFSPDSRNRRVGEALGQGKNVNGVLAGMVAEGVVTARAVYRLSRKMKIPMPISEQVYKIIFEHKNPRKALADLMSRPVKVETRQCLVSTKKLRPLPIHC